MVKMCDECKSAINEDGTCPKCRDSKGQPFVVDMQTIYLEPKVGTFCTRISPGCTHCYASSINKRFGNGLEYTVPNLDKVEFFIDEKILEEPLRRKKPATIFVGDMFDLFHEAIDYELQDQVFAVAAVCKQHTFQFLTKRAARMLEYFSNLQNDDKDLHRWADYACEITDSPCASGLIEDLDWPVPNIWLGTSVESQKYADERIPLLLQTPAAVRFLSVEPMLEAITLDECAHYVLNGDESNPGVINAFNAKCYHPHTVKFAPEAEGNANGISWVICGGESGPGARPFNLAWAESLLEQCRAAGVPFFMKQVGSAPLIPKAMELNARGEFLTETTCGDPAKLLVNSKGGDPSEWPEHLRVRQFPRAEKSVTA